MKTKKYVLISSTVIFSFLILSATTAVVQANTQSVTSNVYIDPHIHLTTAQLPLFKQTLASLNESKEKSILRSIAQTIQTKGNVNSNDIEEITQKLSLTNMSFYSGSISISGSDATVRIFPFTLIASLLKGTNVGYFGPILYGLWIANVGACTINGQIINQINNSQAAGRVYGGFGSIQSRGPLYSPFSFTGVFALIIVFGP